MIEAAVPTLPTTTTNHQGPGSLKPVGLSPGRKLGEYVNNLACEWVTTVLGAKTWSVKEWTAVATLSGDDLLCDVLLDHFTEARAEDRGLDGDCMEEADLRCRRLPLESR